jgi:hypothetical protein
MTVAMITVEILVAIGVACIATALLAILTDKGDDEAIGVPQSIAQRGRGRRGRGNLTRIRWLGFANAKMYLPVQGAGGSKPLFPATDRR